MRSNEELFAEFQQGDHTSLSQLYERLYEPLYCFLYRYTREEQLSIDIVHDTFEQLQRKKHLYHVHKGTVKSYSFAIAYRLLLNKLKRRDRWRKIIPFLAPSTAASFSSDDKIVIQQAIADLSHKQRAVILLSYYEELSQDEIAAILCIPLGTVKSRLHHAIKALKEHLKEDYYAEG